MPPTAPASRAVDPDGRRRPGRAGAVGAGGGAAVGAVGAVLVTVALVLVWVLRARADRPLYVSGLGADGEPTAAAFEVALLLIAVGGFLVAWAARHVRARPSRSRFLRALGAWTPAVTLVVASAAFLLASQVHCSSGCPVPGTPSSTWADLVHTTSATLGFAAAAVAMLQTAFSDAPRAVVRLSLVAAVGLALASGTGGILSLAAVGTGVGAAMEYVAMSIGLGWLAALGGALALALAVRPAGARGGRPS